MNITRTYKYILILALSALIRMDVQADTLKVASAENSLLIHESVNYFTDADQIYLVNDVIGNNDLKTLKYKYKKQNFGFYRGTVWNKFSLKNTSNSFQTFFLEAFHASLNQGILYQHNGNRVVSIQKAGDNVNPDERPLSYRSPIYVIKLKPGETANFVYEAINGGDVLNGYFKLWSLDDFGKHIYLEQYFLGGYFNIMLLILLVFLFFFLIIIKDKTFTIYACYVICLFCFQFTLDGFTSQFLFDNPWLNEVLVMVGAGLAIFFVTRYTMAVLETKTKLPLLHKIFRFIGIYVIIEVFLSIIGTAEVYHATLISNNIVSVCTGLLIISAIFYTKAKGNKVDFYFTLALLITISFVIIFVLRNFNILDSNIITDNALKFGSFFEIVFLSVSTVNRYKNLQVEKEQAQQVVLKNLQEVNEYKDSLNQQLEIEVEERTKLINDQKIEILSKNNNLTDSIEYAKKIQEAALTPLRTVQTLLPKSFVFLKPKDIVSGDFYWVEFSKQKVFFSVIDCTGHGVPGAFMSILGNNYLNQAISLDYSDPGNILNFIAQLNQKSLHQNKNDFINDGLSISLCAINNNVLEFSGAHQQAFIVRKNQLIHLNGDRRPIGYMNDKRLFETQKMQLEKNDMIYLFSDGIVDQFGGEKGKKLGVKAFTEFLCTIAHKPESEQNILIQNMIGSWQGKTPQVDDICVMGVRIS